MPRTLWLLLLIVSSTGCASAGQGTSRSAYESACRSWKMSEAAAREAYWCWHAVGATTYEEWTARELAGVSPAGTTMMEPAASTTLASSSSGR